MCGIAGLFDREVKNKSIIKKITDKIIHRGPDRVWILFKSKRILFRYEKVVYN